MKDKLAEKLKETLIKIGNKSHIDLSDIRIEIKENKDKDFGDFSSNAAMVCAKKLSLTPIDLAAIAIILQLSAPGYPPLLMCTMSGLSLAKRKICLRKYKKLKIWSNLRMRRKIFIVSLIKAC